MFFTKKTNEPPMQRRVSSPNMIARKANEIFQQNADAAITRDSVMQQRQPVAVRQQPQQQKMSPAPATPVSVNAQRASVPSFGAPHKTMAPRDVREGRKLIVGREISLNGEISTCDHLVVEGTVRAIIKGGQTLEISPRGLFEGTVEIQEAVIGGTFEGNIRVLDRLYVKSTGVIRGTVEYGEMEVEPGARIDGQIISMGTSAKSSVQHANDEPEAAEYIQDEPQQQQPAMRREMHRMPQHEEMLQDQFALA